MAYGTVNADVIGTSVAGSNLGAGNASIMKNRIINGAMVIDQRNAGASVTIPAATNTYTLDRYLAYGTGASKFSVQQNAGSVTLPVGFSNYLGVTSLAATTPSATDEYFIQQRIEGYNIADLGWGTSNAKTVTLSFQVYSSLTGTFGGTLQNSAANRIYVFSYSIPVANTWTTVSVTIAGDTSGTWLTTNGIGIRVGFDLGAGSTYKGTAGSWGSTYYDGVTGGVNVIGTNGATFYITGVQLEVGSSATGFEYRQYGQELALCQRYYQQTNIANKYFFVMTLTGANDARANWFLPVEMRSDPTISATASAWTLSTIISGANSTGCSLSTLGVTPKSIDLRANGGSGGSGTAGQPAELYSANGYFGFSSEL